MASTSSRSAGYRVLVPDLFRGKVAKDSDDASHMMDQLNFKHAAEQDIQGCVLALGRLMLTCRHARGMIKV
jgi:carboxymethylenebutenolidase